jgi:preprotein translocase subunit SecF
MYVQWRNTLGVGRVKIFHKPKIDFVRLRIGGYVFSAALLIVGLGSMITRGGPQFGVEFTGGIMINVGFAAPTTEDDIKTALSGDFPTPIVQRVRGEERYIVRIKTDQDPEMVKEKIRRAFEASYGAESADIGEARTVSNQVGGEYIKKAVTAILIASIGILIFLWFRFELIFGAGAVVALFHDVIIVLGLLTVFGQEVDLNVVAALLIVVGYSVNDTIVIYDRIRETIRTVYGMSYPEIINQSINQSLNRTMVTSVSTLFVTLVMLFLGGPGLRGFALVLTLGVLIGTYSSSFVAAPVLYQYQEYRRRRQAQGSAEERRTGKK